MEFIQQIIKLSFYPLARLIKSISGMKTEFTFDASGFQFNRDGENLKEVLNTFQEGFGRLCDELSKVVVSIGVSPDVPAITQIKTIS